MMTDFGGMVGFGWGGMLFGLLVWGLVIALVVVALARLFPQSAPREDPQDTVRQRYARGELSPGSSTAGASISPSGAPPICAEPCIWPRTPLTCATPTWTPTFSASLPRASPTKPRWWPPRASSWRACPPQLKPGRCLTAQPHKRENGPSWCNPGWPVSPLTKGRLSPFCSSCNLPAVWQSLTA